MNKNYLKFVIATLFSWLFFASGNSQTIISEDFSVCSLPSGWSQVSQSGDTWAFCGSVDFGAASTINDPSGNSGNYARMDFSNDPDSTALQTPVVYVGGLTTPELSFWYNSQTTTTTFTPLNSFYVQYWDGSAWVVMHTGTVVSGWTKYTYTLSNTLGTFASGDSVQLRFGCHEGGLNSGGTGTTTFDQDMALDQILLRETPTCFPPAGLRDTNLTTTSNTILFNPIGSGTSMQYEYGAANFTQGTGTSSIISSSSVNLNSLTTGTTYDIYIREICTPGDSSAWAKHTFTTLYTTPQEVDFVGFTGSNLAANFDGWSEAANTPNPSGTTSLWNIAGSAQITALGERTAKVNLYTTSRDEWIISPRVMITSTDVVKFKAAVTSYNGTGTNGMGSDDSVKVLVSSDGGNTWSSIMNFTASSGLTNTLDPFTISLSAYTGMAINVAWYAQDGPVDDPEDYDFHLGSLFIGTPPTIDMKANDAYAMNGCLSAAEPIYAVIENNSPATIDFSVANATVGAAITGQSIANLSTTLTTDSLQAGDTMHVMVGTTNMAASGTYNVKPFVVVSGDGNTGNDTGSTVAMTNLPIASSPQKVNFAGYTGSNLPTVFPGWYEAAGATSPGGSTSFWGASSATQLSALGKSSSAKINIYSTNVIEWIVSPKMTATATDSLLFKAAVTDYNGTTSDAMGNDDSVNVLISTDCGNTWSLLYSINTNNDEPGNAFDSYALSLSAYSGNDIIIGFFATSGPTSGQDYDFHLTDIFIGTPPANDVGVTAILEPTGGCGSSATDVKVAVYNYGNAAQTSIGVSVDVTGSATTTLSTTIASLAPKTADTIVVGNFNTLAGGTYDFTGYTTHAGDQDNTNDTSMVTGIDIGAIPTNPNALTGFTLCEGGDSMIVASGSTAAFRWFNSTNPDVVVSNSDTLSLTNMMTTDTFEVEGYNFSSEKVGATNTPTGGFITSSAGWGVGFDVNVPSVIIDTVTMYPTGTGWFIVNVADYSGTVLQSSDTVFVTGASLTKTKVPVGLTVSSGSYKMTMTYSGLTSMGRQTLTFPYNSPSGAVSLVGGSTGTGNPTSSSYYWFYDWTITVPSCPSARESVIISVDPFPVVNIGSDTAFCGSSFVPFTLDATTPSASYAWNDASTNATLSITSAGTYWCDVTTTICTTRDSISVGANPIPTVTFPNPSFVCANATPDSLTGGMPAGGMYSGTNVSNGEFDPASAGVGTDTLYYTYTDSIGCFATDTAYILVDTVATPVMTPFNDICADNGNLLLNNATPAGGVYSGPGVVGLGFNPDSAGIGTHTIKYVFTGANSCMDSTSADITVDSLPLVSMTLQDNWCLNANPIMLNTGMPMGGTYTIDGTVDTVYAATVAGMDTVVYSYTDTNGCTNTDTNMIAADTVPVVTFATMADVCHMSSTVTLMNGMPMGGTYTGNNVNTNAGTYSTANVGTDTVLYVFTDSNSCTESATQTITVNALPTVSLANFTDVCENAPSFALTGGTPAMGTYKGDGVNGANYDASTSGVGTDVITYVYTDANNCTDSATNTILVKAVTAAQLRFLGEICDNGAAKDLASTGIPLGGVFSGAGMTGSSFDPTVTGAGTQTISYSFTNADNCTDSTTNTILVEASPAFNIVAVDGLVGCDQKGIALTTDITGMTYRWSNGDVSDTASIKASGDVWVKVTDPNTNALCFSYDTISGVEYSAECVGIDEALYGTTVKYFPNPNNGTFNYSLEGFEGMDIDVTIVNAGGQVVYNKTWDNVSSFHNGTIQLEGINSGLYFITLSTEKGNVMHRISVTE